eukprot:TRINITY_DN1060_c0_g1_i1.p1 TRINITY_DN1060_c0_g1~~TRINITY_DN1060_c0_g1_i1.p1  ORF type:complete len:323 (-),score=79.15 TRINITY_DN1060_c0_g1_i1:1494-2462(-)
MGCCASKPATNEGHAPTTAPKPAAAAPAPVADVEPTPPPPVPAVEPPAPVVKTAEPEIEESVPEPVPEPVPVAEVPEAAPLATPEPVPAVVNPPPEVVENENIPIEFPTTRVFVVFYSMYGHIGKLAVKIKEGVDSVPGAEGVLFQVPETLPENVLKKMGAPPKPDIPVLDAKGLVDADAVLFGIPTRFGMMCAQMKAFLDSTGSLWQAQLLAGKPGGFFFSTGTQGGGQETTALTAISQLAHHGMLFVPVGYTFEGLFSDDVHGGSPYGSGTYAGDGTRVPLDLELDLAFHQGKQMAEFAVNLKKGTIFYDEEDDEGGEEE